MQLSACVRRSVGGLISAAHHFTHPWMSMMRMAVVPIMLNCSPYVSPWSLYAVELSDAEIHAALAHSSPPVEFGSIASTGNGVVTRSRNHHHQPGRLEPRVVQPLSSPKPLAGPPLIPAESEDRIDACNHTDACIYCSVVFLQLRVAINKSTKKQIWRLYTIINGALLDDALRPLLQMRWYTLNLARLPNNQLLNSVHIYIQPAPTLFPW